MKGVLTLAIVFIALGSISVLFFTAAEGGWREPQQNSLYMIRGSQAIYANKQSDLPVSSSLVAATSSYPLAVSTLDNDLNNDGNYDHVADPLARLALISAVLVIAVGVVALVDGRFLLALCELPKLYSIWFLVLEHPG